jgi:hypothetical protein
MGLVEGKRGKSRRGGNEQGIWKEGMMIVEREREEVRV